ncbi:MAG: transposase [Verrucomicrobiales bacterium]|nr:transposase [Verrucomicrobiales bacterium]
MAAENPVRFLDAFVASLDLHALGFARAVCASTGRPPYAPAALLKLYLYGYLHRVRSSRLLEAGCRRNVEALWLLGKLTPDFKTIADFRKDNLQPLKAVARRFTLLCRKLELFGGELPAIDGSKFAAVNARDQNFNAGKLQELIDRADARLAGYLQQLDAVDAAGPGGAALSKSELAAKIAALQEKQDWHTELLGGLDEEQKQISVTDPDTRKMPTAHGMIVGYNAQVAVDAKHKLIAAGDVTNEGTDYQQLANVTLEAKASLDLEQAEVVAGFQTPTVLVLLCELGPEFAAKFPTARHFGSWLGLCPDNRITGGKIMSSSTRDVKSRAATALRLAAQALNRAQNHFGDLYRRWKARLGTPKAITAMAHKLARILWHLFKYRQPFDPEVFKKEEEKMQRKKLARLHNSAAALGLKLVPNQ